MKKYRMINPTNPPPGFRVIISSSLAALSAIGIALSVFLLIRHYYPAFGGAAFSCGTGCAEISASTYASVFGTPIPVFGIYFFTAILLIEIGFLLYGRNSFPYFIALMIPVYVAAAVICIILGSLMIFMKAFCHGCVAVYAVILLSLTLAVLGAYKTGIKSRYRSLITDGLSAFKKNDFRPKNIDSIKKSVQKGDASALDLFLNSKGRQQKPVVTAEAENIIKRDVGIASSLGIQSTPVMFINGRKIEGAYHIDVIDEIIKREL